MTTYDKINAFAVTIRARIVSNAVALGNVVQVLDRDEDPAIIASNAAFLPTICVFPLGAGKDTITFAMGTGGEFTSEFQVVCAGYYQFSKNNTTPYSDVSTIRQYAFGLVELFRGYTAGVANFAFNSGVIHKATVEIVPYQEVDYVLDRFVITLFCKMAEW